MSNNKKNHTEKVLEKVSSVEWLIEQINQDYPEITWAFKKECEQAKEMHKEEVENAYRVGWVKYLPYTNAEEYYKKTYGGNNE
jgi:hypothetical protein